MDTPAPESSLLPSTAEDPLFKRMPKPLEVSRAAQQELDEFGDLAYQIYLMGGSPSTEENDRVIHAGTEIKPPLCENIKQRHLLREATEVLGVIN